MKKVNLLSRAEMRKVVGGNPVLVGCEVTCFDWSASDAPLGGGPGDTRYMKGLFTVLTLSCSPAHLADACGLTAPVEGTCKNCTYDTPPEY